MAGDAIVAIVMSEGRAHARRPHRSKTDPQVVERASGQLELRRLVRPDGYASIHGLSITPWVPVPHNPSVLHAIRTLQASAGAYVPEGTTRRDGFDALLEEGWTSFQILEGRLHSRLRQPTEGTPPGPGSAKTPKQVCHACWFWTPTSEMRTTRVGVDIGHLHEVHVCCHCLKEGVIARTTAKGYIAAVSQDPHG